MGLSFEESMRLAAEREAAAQSVKMAVSSPIAPMAVDTVQEDYSVAAMPMTLDIGGTENEIAAYAGEMDDWVLDNSRYAYYPEYSDENASVIDQMKNVKVDPTQINLTQESNSQYIPFEMPMYYDGFNLMNAMIRIHFVNKDGYENYVDAVNVYSSDSLQKIRFAWLVKEDATAVNGKLSFEVQAAGYNSKGEAYLWKTRPNEEMTVLKSLSGNGAVKPDDSWITNFMIQMTNKVAEAQAEVQQAQAAANDARVYAENATASAVEVDNIVNNAKVELEGSVAEAVDTKVSESLGNYYDKEQADDVIDGKIADALDTYYDASEANKVIDDEIAAALAAYYTQQEVDGLFENFDISDQLEGIKEQIDGMDGLADFKVEYIDNKLTFFNGEDVMYEITIESNQDPSAEWTATYTGIIDGKIADAKGEVAGSLNAYKESTDADLLSIHSAIDGLPETLATDYYTKQTSDEKFASKSDVTAVGTTVSGLEASVNANRQSVSTIGTKVAELEDAIAGIDQSPRVTYEATYDAEQIYTLWEVEGEGDSAVRTPKGQFKIQGGGGASTSSVLKIEYVTKTPYVVTVDDEALITYNFSGTDSSGDEVLEGVATWKIGGRTIATTTAVSGENTFDITEYLTLGTQKVTLSITDDAGSLVTKSWTVQKIDVRLESTFNDKLTYPIGDVTFDYTPYGAVSKDIHFVLDGKEIGKVTTGSSGVPMGYTIPQQAHGAHLLEVYMIADVNGSSVESNHILKDIAWFDPANKTPVISTVYQDFTARQYDSTNIEYTVHDPNTETPTVVIAVDGNVTSTVTLTESTAIYAFKTDAPGEHSITITCGETVKTLKATITKLDIQITPVTAGLVFDFNPTGRSNNDADRLWSSGDISMTVSDNFDWVNGGYKLDENGDQYFCIKAGTSAEINYQLFADDAKRNGKEFKLIFKTTNVQTADAMFLQCMHNTTDDDHIGIEMSAHEANIYGQAGRLTLPYSEEDIIEFEFNISKDTEDIKLVMGYEDGVSTRNMVYDDSFNFTQLDPQIIHLGSEECDLHIYRFKAYNTSLTARGILNNFIADARNAEEMINRYDRNQIYDENGQLDPDVLAEKCPWLRVYKVSAPYFTNNKSDKVPGTTVQQIYKDGDPVLDNWTCYDCMHSGQGTSSNEYGAAGRNLDFIMNKSGVDGVDPYFIMGDGGRATEITMTRTSVPVAYLNAKVNIASSNNLTNAMLANRYNQFNPYKRPFIRAEGVDTSFIKDTMEFHNCVIFIQETDTDLSTHREFADTNYHFYAIGNIGDSKKTDDTRLTDMDDKYECCVEIMDVELPLSDFPADTMYDAMGYNIDDTTGEKIYIWAKDENLGILHEKINGEYVLTQDEHVDLNKTYYVDILEHDDFSEDFTYGWRYIYEGDDDAENAEVFDYCKQKWIEVYRFITTSTDEEFKAHIGDYFVLDSALYNYLFTTRYCMVDNRAKNSFWHYSKTGEIDDSGNPIRKWDLNWGYDMDTSLGLNNYGKQVYRYGLEDTDVDEKGEEVFRESDSIFFCRIRDLFPTELKALYNTLESKNAWHAESFLNQCDAWQDEFPEELWRIDIERKYIRTYNSSFINGKGDAQFLTNMSNGKMKYQRREWERSQEKYMASKYQSSAASSDNAVLRCSVPTGELAVQPNYRLKLTPYAYMYLNVKYGTQNPIQMRVEPNKVYEIPFEGDGADIISIYSASIIKSLGDLSACYAATVDTSKASKLTELKIGSDVEGYDNPSLTTLTLGSNYLLEVLNVENVSGLTQSLNLSELHNLRELYAKGSNTGGVTFADGGLIETAELPAIGAMTAKNLAYIETLDIDSYSKLTTLTIENCSAIDVLAIFDEATNLNRVRITGIDWTLEDAALLERIFGMTGIDKDGYNTDKAILAGKVHVPVIRQQQIHEYHDTWPDLEISYDTLIEQFPVTFMNDDGTVLEIQYVDKGGDAVDPTKRTENPLIPVKESSVSHDFIFSGWDGSLSGIFNARELRAVYTQHLRSYTIKYVAKNVTLREYTGLFGENIPYEGDIPVYTAEESGYVYHLFNRWDKSGVIDGNKTVNAIFDRFEYTEGAFEGKELATMTPVEIYALCKLGLANGVIEDKDPFAITIGNDIDFDDIESEVVITEKTVFSGNNYIDTGIQLFVEDRDFVLAVDYKFTDGNTPNATLMQCFQDNGTNGFKLWYNGTAPNFTWGTTSDGIVDVNKREMLVIRHLKGNNNLMIYKSNLDGYEVSTSTLERSRTTFGGGTLVFGCARADDGIYEKYAKGEISWCKIWYTDLGDEACKELANWTHEKVLFEACGFRKYYLSDNSLKRCSFSLLATNLLDRTKKWNGTSSNTGGWGKADLNLFLNSRLYKAIPMQIRSLIKQVKVPSSVGDASSEVETSDCYITIPACIEVDPTMTTSPYTNEGSSISYMTTNESRIRAFSNGVANEYWLRSPNASNKYVYSVGAYGDLNGYNLANYEYGVLIEISM